MHKIKSKCEISDVQIEILANKDITTKLVDIFSKIAYLAGAENVYISAQISHISKQEFLSYKEIADNKKKEG